jgi:hypothetical protein
MITQPRKWDWTSCRKAGALSLDGIQVYRACFSALWDYPGGGWERCSVLFAARQPTRACRGIAKSGRNPMEFANTVIN